MTTKTFQAPTPHGEDVSEQEKPTAAIDQRPVHQDQRARGLADQQDSDAPID